VKKYTKRDFHSKTPAFFLPAPLQGVFRSFGVMSAAFGQDMRIPFVGGASGRHLPHCGRIEKETAARAANLLILSPLPPVSPVYCFLQLLSRMHCEF
jgi:hypothetical protein